MALVTISDAAKLVRKARATLMRDIENGRLAKTVLQDGDVRIDTAELLRAYGRLHSPQAAEKPRETRKPAADKMRIALLEERIRSLERVIALEAELRRVKDQVTAELRTRLADKDHMIKILESKILFLEYDKQTLQARPVPTLEPEQAAPAKNDSRANDNGAIAPSSGLAKSSEAAGAGEKIKAWPTPAQQEQAASTAPAPTSVETAPPSARAARGAPGGVERRHPPKMRGWWARLFSRGEPHGH